MQSKARSRLWLAITAVLMAASLLLNGCGGSSSPNSTSDSSASSGQNAAPAATTETPSADNPPPPQEKVTIRYRLDWLPRGNYAPLYLAIDKGYFAEEGLDVKVDYGDGSGNAVKLVASGEYELGQGDSLTMLVAKTKGAAVKSIFMINQHTPLAWVSLAESGITAPKDMEGKKFGVTAGGSGIAFYRAMATVNGVDLSKIEEVTIGRPQENFLLQKQVDAIVGYIDAEIPALVETLGSPDKLSILIARDWGMNLYGTGMFANEQFLKDHPDVVRRFLKAYARAFDETIKNPDEAVKVLVKLNPDLDANLALEQLLADLDHTFSSETTEAHGWGAMDDETWNSTLKLGKDGGMIETDIPISEVYTNEFLPPKS